MIAEAHGIPPQFSWYCQPIPFQCEWIVCIPSNHGINITSILVYEVWMQRASEQSGEWDREKSHIDLLLLSTKRHHRVFCDKQHLNISTSNQHLSQSACDSVCVCMRVCGAGCQCMCLRACDSHFFFFRNNKKEENRIKCRDHSFWFFRTNLMAHTIQTKWKWVKWHFMTAEWLLSMQNKVDCRPQN